MIAVVVAAAGLTWWLTHREGAAEPLKLYGNVDLRQVSLAFNGSERVAMVLVHEGDRVHKGEMLAKLDTGLLEPQVAEANAQVDAQRAVVERLHNGSRPEEIAQARANLASAEADALNARRQYDRKSKLLTSSAVSPQDVDAAKATMDMADAKVQLNERALALNLAGPRAEDIAQAEAQLRANEAHLAFLRQQLANGTLAAPVNGNVSSRLMEPGEMASPEKPVFSIAVTDPKWVRTYVSETDLPRVHPGMKAYVVADGAPGHRFEGWIGFISPVAEFTPKTVQTEELRTSLVYEVRVFVQDPSDELRLGMPSTVLLPESGPASARAADVPETDKRR